MFCTRRESRFSIAEFADFAPASTSQAVERQGFGLLCLLQYELNIAFGEMDFGANAGRGSAERSRLGWEGLPARRVVRRTSECRELRV
jgi:hypothetical protein